MPKEKNQHKSAAASDEKFRDFFTTTVADIPAEMVRREEEAAEEHKGLFGRLFGHAKPKQAPQAGADLELPTGEVLLEEDDQGDFSTGAEITDEFTTFFTTPVMEQEEPQWTVSGFLSRKKKNKEPENQAPTGEVALDLDGQTAEEEPGGDTIQLNAFEEQTGELPLPTAEETDGPDEPTRRLDGEEEPKPHRNPLLRLFGREEPGEAPFEEPEPEAEEAPALEYNALQDAPAVSEVLAKQNARLTLTSALCALIAAVMLYLGVTATGVIAPLSALDPAIAPGAFLGVELTLLAAGCLLALPVLKNGLKGLAKAAPSRDSLAALAAAGAVLQLLLCFLMLESYEPERMTLFAPLAVLALACTLAGHRVMGESVARNFDLVSAGVEHSAAYRLQNRDLTNLLASGLGEEEPCLLVSRPTALVKDFLKRSGSRRAGDRLAQRLAWGMGGVAVVTAVVALARGKGVLVAAGALVLENGASRNMLKRFFVRPSDFGTFRYLPVSMELLAGIAAGAEKKNCEMLASFSDSGRMTDEIIAHCMNGLIQGMIYLQCDNFDGLIAPLEKAAVPYVIAADNRGHEGALRTYVDYRAAARNAVRFLIGRGHRRIGIVTGAVRDYLYAEMLAGFRGALAEEDVPLNPDWVLSGLGYEQSADQVGVLMNFLKQPELPTAIFTVRDYRAGWLFEAAGRLGIGIPGQLSVLSFDNHSWRGAEVSGLTTFAEPLREQGETAVELLRQWVASGKRPESVELKPELVERASVAALP